MSAIDLCELTQVKAYLSIAPESTGSDLILGGLITQASAYWLWRTGRGAQQGVVPAQSPFVQPVSYDEWYDGNGNQRQFLRNEPVNSVSLVEIMGVAIPSSNSPKGAGYVLDGMQASIVLRGNYRFACGMQNIHVVYVAGFNGTPPDIAQACAQMVATTFRRRGWIDQKSQALPQQGGSVIYRDWIVEPAVEQVIQGYKRRALV